MPVPLQVEIGTLCAVTEVAALGALGAVILPENAHGSGRPDPSSLRILRR